MIKKDIKKKIYGDKLQFKKLEILDINDEVLSLQIRRLKANELNGLMQELSNGKSLEEIEKNEEDMKNLISGLMKSLIYLEGNLLFENDEDMLEMDAIVFIQISNGVMNYINIVA